MKKVLLTGFEPFHKASENPTQEIVRILDAENIEGLITAVLPVEFGRSSKLLIDLIDEHQPDFVVALGQAEGRSQITPEKIAVNLDDARIADNVIVPPVAELPNFLISNNEPGKPNVPAVEENTAEEL